MPTLGRTVIALWPTQIGVETTGEALRIVETDTKIRTGSSKKVPAKFSDTCSVRADGLCIGCPTLVGSRQAGNLNMREFFRSSLYKLVEEEWI